MPAELHETSLIALLAIGFVLALLFGLVANLLKVSPIVGYLVAGIAVGLGEKELSRGLLEHSLGRLGVPAERARALAGRDPGVHPEGA